MKSTIFLISFIFQFWNVINCTAQLPVIKDTNAIHLSDEKRNNDYIWNFHTDNKDSIMGISWYNESIFSGLHSSITNEKSKIPTLDFANFILPFNGKLSRGYSARHRGWDILLKLGDSIKSCLPGKVRYAKKNSRGYGNLIIIRGYNGHEFFYGHLSEILVSENQIVDKGQIIGLGGSTGHSTGPHLHFEIRYNDRQIDISNIVDFKSGFIDTSILIKNQYLPVISENKKVYYKIRNGDTLSGIAIKFHTSVNKLCKLNGLTKKSILKIGKTIRVK